MNKKSTEWLKKEIDVWQRQGLITERSARILKERYRAKGNAILEAANRRSLVIVFAVLGAVFAGLGAVLFFMDRWQFIHDYLKVAVVMLSMLFAYTAGFYFKFRKGHPRIGGALIVLASVLFGCALFINKSIFNVNFSLQQNILIWFAFIFPIGYFSQVKKVLDLALVLISIWMGLEAINWIDLSQKSELYIYLYYFFGILIYALGIAHRQIKKLKSYKGPYQIVGGFLLLAAIYLLTFFDTIPSGFFIKLDILKDLKYILAIASAGLLFLLIELAFRKKRQYTLAAQIYSLITALVLGTASILGLFAGADVAIFNVLFLTLIVGMVVVGINTKEISLINLGLVFFVIDIISRFFDIFWQVLPRSIFFVLGGAILIFTGIYLEITRKRLLARIRW